MKRLFSLDKPSAEPNPLTRSAFGFVLGLVFMIAVTKIFQVNDFDYLNVKAGVQALISGINPWGENLNSFEFFNPPFSVIFLWPLLFLGPKSILIIGGALIFAVLFFHKSWVAFSWFGTNLFLWIVSAGQIDMYVMGSGILLLTLSDEVEDRRVKIFLRILGYGYLLVKPQGGLFIVALYILLRKDWLGMIFSTLVYGVPFINLYPDWIKTILMSPPIGQDVMRISVLGKYGWIMAILLALIVLISKPWKYWQLGGALAEILSPYGMVGIPTLLVLSGVKNKKAIPIVVIFSGCLAALTWINPPPYVDYYLYIGPYMEIYHLGMFGLVLILAIYEGNTPVTDQINLVDIRAFLKKIFL